MPIDALSVLCAQLTRDLLAIAKFLLRLGFRHHVRQLRTASVFRSIKNVAKMSATAELLVLFTRVGSGRVNWSICMPRFQLWYVDGLLCNRHRRSQVGAVGACACTPELLRTVMRQNGRN